MDISILGTFQDYPGGGCSFVLSRGPRKGSFCGNVCIFSHEFECLIPTCRRHVDKYDETFGTPIPAPRVLRPRIPAPRVPTPLTPDRSARKQPRTSGRQTINLEKIPKAIERSNECVVCFERVNPLLLPCGHTTCYSCVSSLKKRQCPMCRAIFLDTQLRRL
jgi:hypothetical protein